MECSGVKQFVPHSMHIPYTSDGLGSYSAETIGHSKTIAKAIPLVLEVIKSSHVQTSSGFTIVDYGTADGGTSMPLMYEAVKTIREKYGKELPITIIYEDQAVNDFKSLFMRLQGFIPGPRSYLMDFQNVFVMACGTNFYSQCVSSKSVHLGFSATCVHWLREKPCDITDVLYSVMTTDPKEMKKFCEQAEKDWELFLCHRAEELAPGGYLVLVQVTDDRQGQPTGATHCMNESIYRLMSSLWKDFVQEGKISQEEFKHTTFALYLRTEEEFRKPFKDPNSPVRRKGLELLSMETQLIPCPHKERWLREKGDSKHHAKRYVNSIRPWSYSTMFSGLSDIRSAEEKAKIVEAFYDRFESLVAKHPEDHGLYFVSAYIVVRKRREEVSPLVAPTIRA